MFGAIPPAFVGPGLSGSRDEYLWDSDLFRRYFYTCRRAEPVLCNAIELLCSA